MAGTSLKCYIVGKENMLKAESPHKRERVGVRM